MGWVEAAEGSPPSVRLAARPILKRPATAIVVEGHGPPRGRGRRTRSATERLDEPVSLGSIRQRGGKLVHAWALRGDLDPAAARSNTFSMEWPPRSGRTEAFPEIDRVAWFDLDEARLRLKEAQVPFLDRLVEALGR